MNEGLEVVSSVSCTGQWRGGLEWKRLGLEAVRKGLGSSMYHDRTQILHLA